MKRLLILALPLTLFAAPYSVIEDKAKLEILSPELREQKREKIRLENGLEALLISDPNLKESGALMMVNVGSLSDPAEYPGLAHFLEHMLFLGTTKYPKESEYFKFISDHGGNLEAFTTPSSTCFFFNVNNDAFLGALDRFSFFFKEPLFNQTGVDREMHAVNQEYEKNVENDAIRQYYILKELANPNNPHHQFSMGNLQSLKSVTQEILKRWYQEHYSANLMKLVIQSNLPLETLQETTSEYFKDIPNTHKEALGVKEVILTPELQRKMIYIEPINETEKLTIIWELPKKVELVNASQPETLICHILGDESEKSLLATLKKLHLAESLGCGTYKINKTLSELSIEITLTEEGVQQVYLVIGHVFEAINQLREKGIPESLFKEIQMMAKIDYQYQNKEQAHSFFQKHAFMLPFEPMETYPEVTLIPQKYDPKAIQELLSVLTPESAQYVLLAPSSKTNIHPERQEKWVGGRYRLTPIPQEIIQKWTNIGINPDIDLPSENPFIPENMTLKGQMAKSEKRIPTPVAVISNERANIYFAQDALFKVPKVSWILTIKTPAISMDDPSKIVMGDLYVKSLQEALNTLSYPAHVAGLDYGIERAKNGITLRLKGYNDKSRKLFQKILEKMKTLQVDSKKFELIKEALLRDYRNFANESPLDQSIEIFKSIVYQDFVKEADKAAAIKDLSFQNFVDWTKTAFSKFFIEGILYGNLTSSEATEIATEIVTNFNGEPYIKSERYEEKVLVMPKNVGPIYLENHTKSAGNAVILSIEEPTFSLEKRAAQQIMMQAIKEPFFGTLRTKQQTGYLVHSLDQELERKLFNLFLVQSSTHDTRDLLARFEEFIESYLQEIGKTELTEDQFNKIRASLKTYLQENPKNIDEMAALLNELAFKYDADFDWITKRIQSFDTLSYENFLQMTKEFLGKGNKRRLAILLQGVLPEENLFMYNKARSLISLRKMCEYEGK